MTVLLDIVLLLAALLSAQLAVAWGEMGSFPPHADKSGLAGLGAVILLMPMRWALLAVALWAGAWRGGFATLPGGRMTQGGIVLGAHLALGVVAYQVFDWIVRGVQADQTGPQKFAVVFGLVLPVVVWLVAFVAVNRSWLGRHPLITAAIVAAMAGAQVAAWRQGYVRPAPKTAEVVR